MPRQTRKQTKKAKPAAAAPAEKKDELVSIDIITVPAATPTPAPPAATSQPINLIGAHDDDDDDDDEPTPAPLQESSPGSSPALVPSSQETQGPTQQQPPVLMLDAAPTAALPAKPVPPAAESAHPASLNMVQLPASASDSFPVMSHHDDDDQDDVKMGTAPVLAKEPVAPRVGKGPLYQAWMENEDRKEREEEEKKKKRDVADSTIPMAAATAVAPIPMAVIEQAPPPTEKIFSAPVVVVPMTVTDEKKAAAMPEKKAHEDGKHAAFTPGAPTTPANPRMEGTPRPLARPPAESLALGAAFAMPPPRTDLQVSVTDQLLVCNAFRTNMHLVVEDAEDNKTVADVRELNVNLEAPPTAFPLVPSHPRVEDTLRMLALNVFRKPDFIAVGNSTWEQLEARCKNVGGPASCLVLFLRLVMMLHGAAHNKHPPVTAIHECIESLMKCKEFYVLNTDRPRFVASWYAEGKPFKGDQAWDLCSEAVLGILDQLESKKDYAPDAMPTIPSELLHTFAHSLNVDKIGTNKLLSKEPVKHPFTFWSLIMMIACQRVFPFSNTSSFYLNLLAKLQNMQNKLLVPPTGETPRLRAVIDGAASHARYLYASCAETTPAEPAPIFPYQIMLLDPAATPKAVLHAEQQLHPLFETKVHLGAAAPQALVELSSDHFARSLFLLTRVQQVFTVKSASNLIGKPAIREDKKRKPEQDPSDSTDNDTDADEEEKSAPQKKKQPRVRKARGGPKKPKNVPTSAAESSESEDEPAVSGTVPFDRRSRSESRARDRANKFSKEKALVAIDALLKQQKSTLSKKEQEKLWYDDKVKKIDYKDLATDQPKIGNADKHWQVLCASNLYAFKDADLLGLLATFHNSALPKSQCLALLAAAELAKTQAVIDSGRDVIPTPGLALHRREDDKSPFHPVYGHYLFAHVDTADDEKKPLVPATNPIPQLQVENLCTSRALKHKIVFENGQPMPLGNAKTPSLTIYRINDATDDGKENEDAPFSIPLGQLQRIAFVGKGELPCNIFSGANLVGEPYTLASGQHLDFSFHTVVPASVPWRQFNVKFTVPKGSEVILTPLSK